MHGWKAARRAGSRLLALAALVAAVAPGAARGDPQFTFRNPPGSADVVWATTAQAGLSSAAGNTSSLGISGEARVARTGPRWQLSSGGDVAFARSRVDVAEDRDGVPGIGPGELRSVQRTTRQSWGLRARVDRFLTERTGAYVASRLAADRPAGKELVAALQAGAALELVRSGMHQVRVELGYDLTYEAEVGATAREIHFARAFVGHSARLDQKLGIDLSAEVLSNIDSHQTATGVVAPFAATRVLGASSLSYALNGRIRLALRATGRFDAAPSPRPPPPGASFQPGYAPAASHWDTTTDVLAIVTF